VDGYHIALFLHLVALVAAGAASAVTHLAEGCAQRAATVHDARQWHMRAGKAARAFPVVIVVLLLTGGYMLSGASSAAWRDGWVIEGIVASVLLAASGGVLGGRARAVGRAMATLDAKAPSTMHRDPLAQRLAWMNTGVAIATMFVMVTKPALAGAFIALAVGGVLGIAIARPGRGAVSVTAQPATPQAASPQSAQAEPAGV
jgi:hypothetical protein